jgi:DNA adenine methylase
MEDREQRFTGGLVLRYLGGKSRFKKEICGLINSLKPVMYYEPFLGGGSIFSGVIADHKIGSDYCEALMTMWKALKSGWEPPIIITEYYYRELQRKKDPNDPMTAVAGFGLSFGGKWFEGWVGDKMGDDGRNHALSVRRTLKDKIVGFGDCQLLHRSFEQISPIHPDTVVYCDPPYEGGSGSSKTGYGTGTGFDHRKFWEWVRVWSNPELNRVFLISEYSAPDDFRCILEMPVETLWAVGGENKKIKSVEKVFTHESTYDIIKDNISKSTLDDFL